MVWQPPSPDRPHESYRPKIRLADGVALRVIGLCHSTGCADARFCSVRCRKMQARLRRVWRANCSSPRLVHDKEHSLRWPESSQPARYPSPVGPNAGFAQLRQNLALAERSSLAMMGHADAPAISLVLPHRLARSSPPSVRFERAEGRCERCRRPHGQTVLQHGSYADLLRRWPVP